VNKPASDPYRIDRRQSEGIAGKHTEGWSRSIDPYTHEPVTTYTSDDEDIFEEEPPPTPPKNPPPQDPALAAWYNWQNHKALELGIKQSESDVTNLLRPEGRHLVKTQKIESDQLFPTAVRDTKAGMNAVPGTGIVQEVGQAAVQLLSLPYEAIALLHDGLTASDPSYIDTYSDGSVTLRMGEGPTTDAIFNQLLLGVGAFPEAVAGRAAGSLKFAEPEAVGVKAAKSIDYPTNAGSYPSWTTVQKRYWGEAGAPKARIRVRLPDGEHRRKNSLKRIASHWGKNRAESTSI